MPLTWEDLPLTSKRPVMAAILLVSVVVAAGLGYWVLAPNTTSEVVILTTQESSPLRMSEATRRAISSSITNVTSVTSTTSTGAQTSVEPAREREFALPIVDRNGLTGTNLTLSDLQGKVVVVEFMEPWCPYCRRTAPILEELYGEYADKSVVFVAVAGPWRGASPKTVASFIQICNSSLIYVYDSAGEAFNKYAVASVPTIFVFSKDGSISFSYNGVPSHGALAKAIDEALAFPELLATCHELTQPVTVDGKWTSTEEWIDAEEIPLFVAEGNGVGYFRIKNDDAWLYVLAESLVDRSLEYDSAKATGDQFSVFIDSAHNDGKSPAADDLWFSATWRNASYSQVLTRKGTGASWDQVDPVEGLEAAIGLDSGNSPHTPRTHVVGEYKIPLSAIGASTFGFFMRLVDSSEALRMHFYWPGPTLTDQSIDPSTWGNVMLSGKPISKLEAPAAHLRGDCDSSQILLRLIANALIRRSSR